MFPENYCSAWISEVVGLMFFIFLFLFFLFFFNIENFENSEIFCENFDFFCENFKKFRLEAQEELDVHISRANPLE